MEEIEAFVRRLCAEGDLSVLTKKLVRTQYQAHFNKTTITREEKDKINEVLDIVVQELAYQSKDQPASTDTGEFVNSSPPSDQGKENLHTDCDCLSSTVLPTTGGHHRTVHKVSRGELGTTNSGQKHLRRIQVSLNENTLSRSSKNSQVRCRSSSAGNSEVPQQRSPRRRGSCESVSGSNARDAARTCTASDGVDGDSDFKVTGCGKESVGQLALLGAAGDIEHSIGNCKGKQLVDNVRNADREGDYSSDEVNLLSVDSDAPASSNRREMKSPKWKKSVIDKVSAAKTVNISSMSSSSDGTPPKVVPRRWQQKKATKMYTVQAALSAIMESEVSSEEIRLISEEEEKSSSSLEQPLRRSQPSGNLMPTKVQSGLKTREYSFEKKRCSDHLGRGVRPSQQPGQGNTQSVNIASQDSQHDESLTSRTGSDSILRSGFSAAGFFQKKVVHVAQKPNMKKSKRPRTESDTDVSCSSMPSPMSKIKSAQNDSHKTRMLQIDIDSDSQSATILSDSKEQVNEESPEKNKRKSYTPSKSGSDGKKKRTVLKPTPPVETVSPKEKCEIFVKSAKCKKKMGQHAQKSNLTGQNKSDDSDVDDVPLSILQCKGKKPNREMTGMPGSKAANVSKKPQKTVIKIREVQTLKNRAEKEKTAKKTSTTETETDTSSTIFTPPISPALKKSVKRGMKTYGKLTIKYKVVVEKSETGSVVFPEDKNIAGSVFSTSENTEDDTGSKRLSNQSARLPSTSTPHVFSLSESADDSSSGLAQSPLTSVVKQGTSQVDISLSSSPAKQSMDNRLSKTPVLQKGRRQTGSTSRSSHTPVRKKGKKQMSGTPAFQKGNGLTDDSLHSALKDRYSSDRSTDSMYEFGEDGTLTPRKLAATIGETSCTGALTPEQRERDECKELWCAKAYHGEPLKFPVIMLQDVLQRERVSPASNGPKMVSSKQERNIFEILELSTRKEQTFTSADSVFCESQILSKPSESHIRSPETHKSPQTHTSASEIAQEQSHSFVSSVISSNASDTTSTASLDESRTVLKKQRTVKKITPKLRTTLKLRKQISPDKTNVSSEVEEWAVVWQGEQECNGNGQHRDDFGRTDRSTWKRHCSKKSRKRKAPVDSSEDDDDLPLMKSVSSVSKTGDSMSESDNNDFEEVTPVKAKKSKSSKRKAASVASSSEDDLPLKTALSASVGKMEDIVSESDSIDFEDATPIKVKPKKRKLKAPLESSDEDYAPLKPRSAPDEDAEKDSQNGDIEIRTVSESEADTVVLSPMILKKSKKKKQQVVSSDEDDDVPLKPPTALNDKKTEESHTDHDSVRPSEDDATPVKIRTSLKAPKLVIMSSDDGMSPMKVKLKPSQDSESDLDTSSLSSEDENEALPQPTKNDEPRIKVTVKKVQPTEKVLSDKTKGKKNVAPSQTQSEESPYLKRLRQICRAVGIFVRNDIHFAGCKSDRQKIERLKEALKKAGMKGQPSLSKVDSVNLKREAEALDTDNIIEMKGRPKRQPKDAYSVSSSSTVSLSPIKRQFSRIQDLISESESD